MGISPRRSGRSAASSSSSAPHHHGSGSSHSTNPPTSPRKRRNSMQSHNPSPPPLEPDSQERDVASPRDLPMEDDDVDDIDADDDEEDDEDDASAEITRCVCGQQEYPFPDADVEDTGFMICCERCNVWQHGPCVGVMSENEAPDVYFCEECRPDLHELGNRSQGSVSASDCSNCRIKQTRWIGGPNPLQSTRRKKSTTLAPPVKHDDSIPSPDPSETTHKERKQSPKKGRTTMNSRDAAYDYSALFNPHVGPPNEDEMKMDDGSPPPGRGRSRRGKRLAEDEEEERGNKRRRESDNSENEPSKARKKRGTNDSDSKNDESASELPGSTTPLLEAPPRNGGKRGGHGGKRRGGHPGGKMERVDSEEPPMTPTTLRRFGEEMMKPARARIPQARSGLNEMRKRVGAILEYVGRLQLEAQKEANANGSPLPWNGGSPVQSLEPVPSEREEPASDDTGEGEYEKPDLDSAPSMLIMQYLTKRCVDFEVKFGKYPGRYP
jgi:PHD-finger